MLAEIILGVEVCSCGRWRERRQEEDRRLKEGEWKEVDNIWE